VDIKRNHVRTRYLLSSPVKAISTELSSTAQRKSRLADLRLIGMCMVSCTESNRFSQIVLQSRRMCVLTIILARHIFGGNGLIISYVVTISSSIVE